MQKFITALLLCVLSAGLALIPAVFVYNYMESITVAAEDTTNQSVLIFMVFFLLILYIFHSYASKE